jgi:hypothetical protein
MLLPLAALRQCQLQVVCALHHHPIGGAASGMLQLRCSAWVLAHLQGLLLRLLEEAHVVEAGGAVEVVQRVGVGAGQQVTVQPERLQGCVCQRCLKHSCANGAAAVTRNQGLLCCTSGLEECAALDGHHRS